MRRLLPQYSRGLVAALWLAAPVLLLLALYWPGLNTWFYQDDFGWLNLRHDVHSARDLAVALFAPKAHGNLRPLGENAWWLAVSAIFGADPLPFHILAFLTQSAGLLLFGSILRRLTGSALAAFSGQVLWIVNPGLAPALGWSSIYNQVLSGFFFLLAFWFLLHCVETGRRAHAVGHWAAFLLGLGALEINVVYPALAAVYAILYARPALRKIAWMFPVAALSVLVHFYLAPPPTDGVYAPRLDARLPATFWTYWTWALGPMPPWLTLLVTAAVCLLIAWSVRRRRYLALVGLAWFAIPLLPYLPLPAHKMDYYLAVPSIGIAIIGASAIAQWKGARAPWLVLAAACLAAYLGASLPKSLTVTRWQEARGDRVADLVLGVQSIRESSPQPIILLEGIDTDLFWAGIADLPFRALDIPRVYLAPGASAHIQAAPELVSKYVLPAALARSAALYRFDGSRLHRAPIEGLPPEDQPHLINLADSVFREYFGAGWREEPGGNRSMDGAATVRIGGPRRPAEHLYIGIFDTRDFHLNVTANGIGLPVKLAFRNRDLSEFRAELPPAALSWKLMEVSLKAGLGPLRFGYLEVR